MSSNKKAFSFFMSLLIAMVVSIIVFFLTYTISCWLSPPYIIDEGGEKHPTMPIGQVMIASIFAGITVILSFIIVFKKIVKHGTNV